MSKMDLDQFTKACNALASAWSNIRKSGQVYGLMDEGEEPSTQMDWGTMCELFPGMPIEFIERNSLEYRWEARINIEGVVVCALLTPKQYRDVQDKEAE